MIIRKDWPPSSSGTKRQILFPLDGSESSLAVAQWGIRYLDNAEASIYLLIVVRSLDKDYNPDTTTRILEETKNLFEKENFQVVKTECIVDQNIPDAICRFADAEHIEHIIMGTNGKTFGPLMIGSSSRAVMEKANQPVLIIKNPHLPAFKPEDPAHSVRNQPRSVLIPVDTQDTAERLIPLMHGLLDKQSAIIHLLHVVTYDPYSAAHISNQYESGKKIIELNRQSFEEAGYWVAAAEHKSGDPLEVILNYAKERGVDQITVLSRHFSNIEKFLFGSVSTALLNQDTFKTLVFGYGKRKKKNDDKIAL